MIDHIRHKSDAEHHPRLFVRKTTALHVEERLFIKLTGRHAMRTFHIVGINLEPGAVGDQNFFGYDFLRYLRGGILPRRVDSIPFGAGKQNSAKFQVAGDGGWRISSTPDSWPLPTPVLA